MTTAPSFPINKPMKNFNKDTLEQMNQTSAQNKNQRKHDQIPSQVSFFLMSEDIYLYPNTALYFDP